MNPRSNRSLLLALLVSLALCGPCQAEDPSQGSVASVESLAANLGNASPTLRRRAARALLGRSPTYKTHDALIRALDDPEVDVRWPALLLLNRLEAYRVRSSRWVSLALCDPDARVRFAALQGLLDGRSERRLGSFESSCLAPCLDDSDPGVRLLATRLLDQDEWDWSLELAPPGGVSLPRALRAAARDADWEVRAAAMDNLGERGLPARGVILEGLRDPHPIVRRRAAFAIRYADYETETIASILISALDDPDSWIRGSVLSALSRAGLGVRPAVPRLRRILSDPSADLGSRTSAMVCLQNVVELEERRDDLVEAMASVLVDERADAALRIAIAETFSLLGERASAGLDELASVARSASDPRVEQRASELLRQLGLDTRKQGQILWWVPLRAYLWETLAILVAFACWFQFARRFPQARPAGRRWLVGHLAQIGVPPTLFATQFAYHVVTRPWAEGFLPEPFLVLLPLPVTIVLSTGFLCGLGTLWAVQRPPGEEPLPETSSLEPPGVGEVGEGLGSIAPEQGELSAGLGEEVLDA